MTKKLVLFFIAVAMATTSLLSSVDASRTRPYIRDTEEAQPQRYTPVSDFEARFNAEVSRGRITHQARKLLGYDDTTHSGSNGIISSALDFTGDLAFYVARNRAIVYGSEVLLGYFTGMNPATAALAAHGMTLMADVLWQQGFRGGAKSFVNNLYENKGMILIKALTAWQIYEHDSLAVYQIASASRVASRYVGETLSVAGGEMARHNMFLGQYFWDKLKSNLSGPVSAAIVGTTKAVRYAYEHPEESKTALVTGATKISGAFGSLYNATTQGVGTMFNKVKNWFSAN
jgi:hypothetical protein